MPGVVIQPDDCGPIHIAHRISCQFIHPDCGFWMLKRSVADRKIAALASGRDRYLGI